MIFGKDRPQAIVIGNLATLFSSFQLMQWDRRGSNRSERARRVRRRFLRGGIVMSSPSCSFVIGAVVYLSFTASGTMTSRPWMRSGLSMLLTKNSSRTRRAMAMRLNPLDEIEGVGPSRKRALLHAFGSARGVSRASVDDLTKVEGLSEPLAQRIHDHFRKG